VDILVRPADLGAVRRITVTTLERSGGRGNARSMGRLGFWSVRLACADRDLQVDFYAAIMKGWITYADVDVIFSARRQVHPLFCAPDPLHERLLIAAKELFAYARIRERYHAKLASDDFAAMLASAVPLFSAQLTDGGCRLIARAAVDPTVTGRPTVRASALLKPRMMVAWARQRRNGWLPITEPERGP
jgi:hypothetical protein